MTRNVRVTIEAEASEPSASVLRLHLPSGSCLIPLGLGVTVEDITPPRDWRDGDVVQHVAELWTLTRRHGKWLHSLPDTLPWDDESVSQSLVDNGAGWNRLAVLRYQAGEDQ